ncbi:MAG: sensor histidine kinase [Clostridiaceae bacterium]|jgi:hypothetical protein|nr:sensor histidine kinase [Clostridiaceae bacterium]
MRELSLHLLDIAENSLSAGAATVNISLEYKPGVLRFRVSDNGKGMEKEFLDKVTSPFTTSRTTRKVGMGIPLLKNSAEITGGSFRIKSGLGAGTVVEADFITSSIDRIPIGNIDETMKALILSNPSQDFELKFKNGEKEYELKTVDIKNYLKGVPIQNSDIINWIGESIREGLKEIFGGVLNEISG